MSDSDEELIPSSSKKSKKRKANSFFDDQAELSGSDVDDGGGDDEDEEEDDGEDVNDYVRDGFVVDDIVEDELDDDDELFDSDDDPESDDDDYYRKKKKKDKKMKEKNKNKRVRIQKQKHILDEDDMLLIHEARGGTVSHEKDKKLFDESSDEDDRYYKKKKSKSKKKKSRDSYLDEEDIIDDEDDLYARGEGGGRSMGQVSEAQLTEATEIFGDFTSFLEQQNQEDGRGSSQSKRNKYKERGVGVDLGVGSDEEVDDEDDESDEDLFTTEEAGEGPKPKRTSKKERRAALAKKRAEYRKARLRRAFEPVQLIENFCTDRDDEIRRIDAPERYFDWNIPFHGASEEEEEEEAMWIMARIPQIAAEYLAPPVRGKDQMDDDLDDAMEKKQKDVIESIIHALRFMHNDKLEPEFISRYRADVVTSEAVRNHLPLVFDQDAEWDRLLISRKKVNNLFTKVTSLIQEERRKVLKREIQSNVSQELESAKKELDDSITQEAKILEELEQLGDKSISKLKIKKENDDNDEADDDLFGQDEDQEEDEAKKEKKSSLRAHLDTVRSLIKAHGGKVSSLEIQLASGANAPTREEDISYNIAQSSLTKICTNQLWSWNEYDVYLASLTEQRQILDVARYVQLIQEGNESILAKMTNRNIHISLKGNKRSRRFDRDFYRTCVSEGLRKICYKFVLSPIRVGIVLEDNINNNTGFDYLTNRKIVDVDVVDEGAFEDDVLVDPKKWQSPVIPELDPTNFAIDLVASGELVLLSSTAGANVGAMLNKDDSNHPELKDPLKGCRYIAAMELAAEPRVKRYLRTIYRKKAMLTTYPSSKGTHEIDSFSEFFGLHLVKDKPLANHFPLERKELDSRIKDLSPEERKEVEEDALLRERDSCLQYLRILKAERNKDIHVRVHLPFMYTNKGEGWHKESEVLTRRRYENISCLMQPLERIYIPQDETNEEWNKERIKILQQAIISFLLPQFESEAKKDLREAAFKYGVESSAASLYSMALEGPYRPTHYMKENRFLLPTADLPIVGVVCTSGASTEKEPTCFASVSERGELVDQLSIPFGTRLDDVETVEKITKFLIHTRPSAVLVGTSSGFKSRMIARQLTEIVTSAMQKWHNRFIQLEHEDDDDYNTRVQEFRAQHPNVYDDDDEEDESSWKCNVDLIDDNVCQLFGRSIRGKKEFPDTTMSLKVAVSIGRYAQNPLAELTYAWSVASDTGMFGTEMLFLNIHPLQQLLPKTLLLKEYERVLCHATAEVGVDINASSAYDHAHGLLQFVPGLGPRKAASIRQSLIRLGGVIESRKALLAKRIVGPCVYNNAVAYLRIREKDQLLGQHLHPLDDTRLHPDVYHKNKWAVKIAIDAMEPERPENSEEFAIKSLRDAMANSQEQVRKLFDMTKEEWEDVYGPTFNVPAWDPKKNVPADSWRDNVEELDLETFAKMIENDGMGKWLSHLLMIKWEFRLPFMDPRKPMEPLTGDKLFRLLTGENDYSLRPGREVTGKVTRITEYGARVILEGDIPGFIHTRNLSDDHVDTPDDVVKGGQFITAIINEVKKDHISLELSLRQSDFKKLPSNWERPRGLPALDEHFDIQAAISIEKARKVERDEHIASLFQKNTRNTTNDSGTKRRSGRTTRRACAHPAFRNAKHEEVDKELRDAGEAAIGEALIRPSSQNCDSLAVHWVVRLGSIKVIEVLEEEKDADTSIGKKLKIKNKVFESIDELLGTYIDPMNYRVDELQRHRKFMDIPEKELDAKLIEMKKGNPSQIFYNFCWNEQHPGYGSIRFILSRTPRGYPIGLHPDGFQWQAKIYSNLDKLIADFKVSPSGPSSRSTASGRPGGAASITSSLNPRSMTTDKSSILTGASSVKPSRWGATKQPTSISAPSWGRSGWKQPAPPPGLPPSY